MFSISLDLYNLMHNKTDSMIFPAATTFCKEKVSFSLKQMQEEPSSDLLFADKENQLSQQQKKSGEPMCLYNS
ncbi:hypothetical protein RIF29_19050 [Crotalaria pallida]|uniref:Uncharacterized protein n=1 Tax=Crotalaria pallida TaxID=3830 RepID=A0AAN9F036_CROPI